MRVAPIGTHLRSDSERPIAARLYGPVRPGVECELTFSKPDQNCGGGGGGGGSDELMRMQSEQEAHAHLRHELAGVRRDEQRATRRRARHVAQLHAADAEDVQRVHDRMQHTNTNSEVRVCVRSGAASSRVRRAGRRSGPLRAMGVAVAARRWAEVSTQHSAGRQVLSSTTYSSRGAL